jgi:hypothetical protein
MLKRQVVTLLWVLAAGCAQSYEEVQPDAEQAATPVVVETVVYPPTLDPPYGFTGNLVVPFKQFTVRGRSPSPTVDAVWKPVNVSTGASVRSDDTFCVDILLGTDVQAGAYTIDVYALAGDGTRSTPVTVSFTYEPTAAVIEGATTCAGSPSVHCTGGTLETVCNDNLDNDCDGMTDNADPECGAPLAPLPPENPLDPNNANS